MYLVLYTEANAPGGAANISARSTHTKHLVQKLQIVIVTEQISTTPAGLSPAPLETTYTRDVSYATAAVADVPSKDPQTLGNPGFHVFYYSWYGSPKFDGEWQHWNHQVRTAVRVCFRRQAPLGRSFRIGPPPSMPNIQTSDASTAHRTQSAPTSTRSSDHTRRATRT
mmetsp:Transcript_27280/g.71925  ORF Transcript_27280/g.71925 Transcript_27280/m.71925 type:complete len:168 (-) Transcript_27280:234-737(-)